MKRQPFNVNVCEITKIHKMDFFFSSSWHLNESYFERFLMRWKKYTILWSMFKVWLLMEIKSQLSERVWATVRESERQSRVMGKSNNNLTMRTIEYFCVLFLLLKYERALWERENSQRWKKRKNFKWNSMKWKIAGGTYFCRPFCGFNFLWFFLFVFSNDFWNGEFTVFCCTHFVLFFVWCLSLK